MTLGIEYQLEHLISKRAAGRYKIHFNSQDDESAPVGFKPHESPLSLSRGTPNAGFFPVESIEIDAQDAPFQSALGLSHTNNSLEHLPKDGKIEDDLKKLDAKASKVEIKKYGDGKELIDIKTGFQYSSVKGLPLLVQFCKEFISKLHKPAYEDWDLILSSGAGDGILKCIDAVINPGDTVLMEEFTFTPSMMSINESGGIAVPVKLDVASDSEGIDIEYLTDLLENWETLKPGLKKPKALYTIPTGQNPTGLTQSVEFRKKILALAEKYDFIIIEDDPYGYLTLPPYKQPDGLVKLDDFVTMEDYIKNHLTPSYLEIDTYGRVLRIETFSKLFAPGLRVGFIVGHKRMIEVIGSYSTLVTKFPSGVAQTVLQNVIQQKFGGVDGWIQWILKMRIVYIHRRNLMLYQLKKSLVYEKGLIDIIDPKAGMFITVYIKFPTGTDVVAKIKLLTYKCTHYGVGVVPGFTRAVDKDFSIARGSFFRLTFAPLSNDDEIIEASKRFITAVDDFFEKGLEF